MIEQGRLATRSGLFMSGTVVVVMALMLSVAGCDTLGLDSKGNIEVAVSVTGQPGAGTFLVRWNDRSENVEGERTVEGAGTVTFDDVPTGETGVSLVEMPEGCSTDDVQKIVTVEADATATVNFAVVCDQGGG